MKNNNILLFFVIPVLTLNTSMQELSLKKAAIVAAPLITALCGYYGAKKYEKAEIEKQHKNDLKKQKKHLILIFSKKKILGNFVINSGNTLNFTLEMRYYLRI